MIDLKQYRENARENNLCSEYSEKWDSCHSNKQFVDMAFGVKGVDYLCDTIAKGWGISPDVICGRFGSFINGRYVSEQNGYTSKMYCKHTGNIKADTTLICLIDSDVVLDIPNASICEVYSTGKCKITVFGEGRAAFVCYGNPDDIVITGSCGNMKRINKKERDHYE